MFHKPLSFKKGKIDCLIWNDKTNMPTRVITKNEMTNTENEAGITYGYIYMVFCIWVHNMCISFPHVEISLSFIDISACFCFPCVFADLIGAFGLMIGTYFLQ